MAACQHCGREAHERDQFCQYCGHRLDTAAAPLQPALVASAVSSSDGAHAADAGATGNGTHPTPALWHASDSALGSGGIQPVSAAAEVPASAEVPAAVDNSDVSDLDTLTVPDPEPEELEPKSRLLIRKAASERDPEREEVLGGRDIAIGRSPSCDIVLEGDELASRRHALIRARGGRYTLVDLGSSNGTYVNGYEIHGESELHDGDRIAIGSHELIFAVGAPGPNASVAGVRASNLPPHPAAATLRPTAMEGEDVAVATEESVETDAEHPAQTAESAGDSAPSDADGAVAPVSRAESKTAPLSAATPEELEALRLQIADIAGALARKADTESRAAQHYHDALAEARDRLDALLQEMLARQEQETQEREQRSELAQMAREAADHPRHLDYLSKLSENAGAIADSLDAESSGTDTLDALRELLARVNESLD